MIISRVVFMVSLQLLCLQVGVFLWNMLHNRDTDRHTDEELDLGDQ